MLWKHDHRDAERRALWKKLERESLDFEKWLITLATGTLVLSVTLLQNLIFERSGTLFLMLSWIALVASIFAGLIDRLLFIFTLSAHPLFSENPNDERQEARWLRYWSWSERMSWIQTSSFFLGILFLLIFALQAIDP